MTEITNLDTVELLKEAENGSYYFIAGCGGDLQEWVDGYEKLMREHEIGTPVKWYRAIGANINGYVGANFVRGIGDPFQNDVTCLLFPLDELDLGKLAMFKIMMEDRWFDDVVQNMRERL